MVEEQLTAVWARLLRIADTGDPSPALEPQALTEARQLTELLDTNTIEFSDITAWYALGWLHFHRYTALPDGQGSTDLGSAVKAFTPCFLTGTGALPEPLLPILADTAAPYAELLFQQARDSADPDLLTAAVDLCRRIAQAAPADHPHRGLMVSNLGLALRDRFRRTGDLSDLDQAIVIGQEAARAAPTDYPRRALILSNLGLALRDRFRRTGDLPDLDQAIDHLQAAVQATPTDPTDRAGHLNTLGLALRERFGRTGDLPDLDQAIDHLQAAVQATPTDPTDPTDRADYLNNLGLTLEDRFKRTGDLSDLDQVIDRLQAAVRVAPTDYPDRVTILSNLGLALQHRFRRIGDLPDLDQAIDHLQTAVRVAPTDHPDRADYLNPLGLALADRFERTGNLPDLDQAIDRLQTAVQATSTDHPDRARKLSNLGRVLLVRFGRMGDLPDLDQAIDRLQAAVRVAPTDHPDRADYLNPLGLALGARFGRTGDLPDLDLAIGHLRAAVRATPAGHPYRASTLSNLGLSLYARFGLTGDQADLDQAIDDLQAAVHAPQADHSDRASALSSLGGALQLRFGRTGDLSDLDQAISIGQEAVHTTPTDHPNRASILSNLGLALGTRFGRTGNPPDLDQAISIGQEVIHTTPTDHPNRASILSNLGMSLRDRFQRTGDLPDLDQAVDGLRAAVRATPTDHPDRARMLSSLGGVLQVRFERAGNPSDLDQAITIGQEAVHTTPTDHPNRAGYLSNLGSALHVRFRRAGDPSDLEQAVVIGREVVDATPVGHPDRAGYLNNLGLALVARFERTGDQTDLDQSIDWHHAAGRAAPAGHPDRAVYLSNLGLALRDRFGLTGDQVDLNAAVSVLGEAGGSVSAVPSVRIRAAWTVAGLIAGSEAGQAAEAAEAAVRLLPEVTLRQLRRGDLHHALGRFAGLARDATALALADPRRTRQERATRALRLLEAGRAVLLGQALDTRSDLTDLNRQRPDLAARFVQLRDQLDQPTGTAADGSGETDTRTVRQDRDVHDRHQLARDFARTLAEIRDLDEFASFALPPATEELLTQAQQGPIVVFNVSNYRSDALLLTRAGITYLELPQLTTGALSEKAGSFRQALHTAIASGDKTQRRQAQDVMTQVLQWLWDTAAGPVLDALGHHRQPPADTDWPRVWWVPGGLLGLLPLHAAGYHTDAADDPHRRTVMDRVVSSHTPTVRALRYARQHTREHTPHPDTPAQGLVVAMPTTPGLPHDGRLNHVSTEAEVLRRHLPRTVLLSEPDPDSHSPGPPPNRPTKAAVLDHLPRCHIAHFACHGASHPTDPSQSLLLLHDHQSDPLTVASLTSVRLGHAQLAYLSACRTAALDAAHLVDEAIHLTSAFQLAGFPHVVGTLWEIDDGIAVTVADTFYTHLRTPDGTIDTNRAAWALHQAVRSIRDGHDLPGPLDRTRTPFLWAAYLHAGA
ncbi:CHAT domain-containing protein [Streptomyces sp. NPDC055025]